MYIIMKQYSVLAQEAHPALLSERAANTESHATGLAESMNSDIQWRKAHAKVWQEFICCLKYILF